jgi:hypothetical protein
LFQLIAVNETTTVLSPRTGNLAPPRGFRQRVSPKGCIPRRIRGRTLGFDLPDIVIFLLFSPLHCLLFLIGLCPSM